MDGRPMAGRWRWMAGGWPADDRATAAAALVDMVVGIAVGIAVGIGVGIVVGIAVAVVVGIVLVKNRCAAVAAELSRRSCEPLIDGVDRCVCADGHEPFGAAARTGIARRYRFGPSVWRRKFLAGWFPKISLQLL